MNIYTAKFRCYPFYPDEILGVALEVVVGACDVIQARELVERNLHLFVGDTADRWIFNRVDLLAENVREEGPGEPRGRGTSPVGDPGSPPPPGPWC